MILINASSKDAVKIFQPFYPIHPPLGIGYLLSAAERKGIKAYHIDQQVENDIEGTIENYIKELKPPYVFCLSVLTVAFKNALSLSQTLKNRYPDSYIVFGGVHPTAVPDEVLSYSHIDAVIRGEGETSLCELYACIKGGNDFTHIRGLSYKKNDHVIHNENAPVPKNLDAYPPFPYHHFNPEKYDMGFVISSRGCPYHCIFCSCPKFPGGSQYRYRSSRAIVDELEMLHRTYKKKHVLFVDDNLLVNKERIYALADLIKHRGLHTKMQFSFQARGDTIEYALCKEMFDAGFKVVIFGLETASEELMKKIKKGETVAQCSEAVHTMKNIGFTVAATFVYGLPGERHEDRVNCLRLSKKLQLDFVRFNNVIPYPGTELYETARAENRLHIQGLYENFIAVSGITESPFKKIPFAYIPEGNTEDEIRRDVLLGHVSFYVHIFKTLNVLLRKSKGSKWFSTGGNLSALVKKIPALLYLWVLLGCKFFQCMYYVFIKKETALSFRYAWKLLFR